jgi:hypothetical protein
VERSYRQSTRLLGLLIALLGLAMIAITLARGGGPLAIGVVVGVLFTVLGAARAYLAGGVEPRRDRP